MKIHYQNRKGEEKCIDNVLHLQNIDSETFEAIISDEKALYLKTNRIEGIFDESVPDSRSDSYKELWKRLENRLVGLMEAYSDQEKKQQQSIFGSKAIIQVLDIMNQLKEEAIKMGVDEIG